MATQIGRAVQDENLNAHHINGAGTAPGKADFIVPRKARVGGGRKPLGDLSNAGKPINEAYGKKALDGSLNAGKPSFSQRTIANKASDKSRTSSRKALSDISNSGKPHVPEIKNKNSLKPSSLREEPLDPSAIAEERCLHNHEDCIKSQLGTVDAHQFFKTVGLENDSDDDLTISLELPAISKLKSEIENAHLELESVPEQFPEMRSLFAQPGSPEHCQSPKLLSGYTMWDDFAVNFKLIESPKLCKS